MDIDTLNKVAMGPFLPKKDIKDLVRDKVYKVTSIRMVRTKFGYAVVVELDWDCQVFLPKRVTNVLVENREMFDELEDKVGGGDLYIHYNEGDKFRFLVD